VINSGEGIGGVKDARLSILMELYPLHKLAAQRFALPACVLTGSTTRAGVDSLWEQEKPEARKKPKNAAPAKHSPTHRVHALLGGLTSG